MDMQVTASKLRREANDLIERSGILRRCQKVGDTFIGGSYHADLMVWRDIDIYVAVTDINLPDILTLGCDIVQAVGGTKASFLDTCRRSANTGRARAYRQNTDVRRTLRGMYWCIETGDTRKGAWKIDLWVIDPSMMKLVRDEADALNEMLSPDQRNTILHLKQPYRPNGTFLGSYIRSTMIYEAVVRGDVRTFGEFESYAADRCADAYDTIPDWSL
jgi:hypothetical protein